METSPLVHFWHSGEIDIPVEALIAWARAQRLLPLIGWRAEREGWTLPSALKEAAQTARYRRAAEKAIADQQLRSLATLARALDFSVAIVKGPVIGEAYPASELRPYGDIDLFVSDAMTSILVDALKQSGYKMNFFGDRPTHLLPMEPPDPGYHVEVHGLPYEGFSFEPLEPWSTYPGLWIPEPVTHFIYLVDHGIRRHELQSGLLHFIDLSFWTASWTDKVWERVYDVAQELRLLRTVGLALALLPFAWPCEILDLPYSRFPKPPQSIVEAGVRAMFGHGPGLMPHIARDVQERSVAGWFRYVKLVLLGNPQMRYGLPWTEKVGFYLWRPFRLLGNYGSLVLRLLGGDRQSREALRRQRALMEWLRGSE